MGIDDLRVTGDQDGVVGHGGGDSECVGESHGVIGPAALAVM